MNYSEKQANGDIKMQNEQLNQIIKSWENSVKYNTFQRHIDSADKERTVFEAGLNPNVFYVTMTGHGLVCMLYQGNKK